MKPLSMMHRLVKPKSWVNGWQVTHYDHHNRHPDDHENPGNNQYRFHIHWIRTTEDTLQVDLSHHSPPDGG
jgi:hypothetical protein